MSSLDPHAGRPDGAVGDRSRNLELSSPSVPADAPGAWSTLSRLLWLCPIVGIVAVGALLMAFGLSVWTALVAALLLACPAVLLWGVTTQFGARRRTP